MNERFLLSLFLLACPACAYPAYAYPACAYPDCALLHLGGLGALLCHEIDDKARGL